MRRSLLRLVAAGVLLMIVTGVVAMRAGADWTPIARVGAMCGLRALAQAAPGSESRNGFPRYQMIPQRVGGALSEPFALHARNGLLELELDAVATTTADHLFSYNGRAGAPTLRLAPGDRLRLNYVDQLPATSRQMCSLGPCTNVTNLHFHGYGGSPDPPADDVLTVMIRPGGGNYQYDFPIPPDQPPGLYWYHTHPHGQSEQQVLDGMSGAIVIEGMQRYVPAVRGLREQILILRGIAIMPGSSSAKRYLARVQTPPKPCGDSGEPPDRVVTVNTVLRPALTMRPRERQLWRIVNASADHYADVRYTAGPLDVVALDGYPLLWRDPGVRSRRVDHVLLPPASRVEAIVQAPPAGTAAQLRTDCVDTGKDGDPNPAAVLADVNVAGPAWKAPNHGGPVASPPPLPAAMNDLQALENQAPSFVAAFTEGDHKFYINKQIFSEDAAPMVHVKTGTLVHWRIANDTDEVHPFHIHQVHFLPYAQNGIAVAGAAWVDTVNVPVRGNVDVLLDATGPVVRGVTVFHCHLLNHEDKGMMAKVAFD